MATRLIGFVGISVALTYAEKKFVQDLIPALYEPSSLLPFLPRAFGLALLLMAMSSWYVTFYGLMAVGKARRKYREMAEKDGEKDAEARYSLPNVYVDGNTKPARAFNCVQRSHQQALETLPQMLVVTIIAAVSFPLSAFLSGLGWLVGRVVWANGYAESDGEPGKRYGHSLSFLIWVGLVMNMVMAMMSSVNVIVGSTIMW